MTVPRALSEWTPWLDARAGELSAAIRFLTRLPLPRPAPTGGAALARAAWAFPLAGAAIGLVGAVVLVLVRKAGLPAWPAAVLALAATMAVTGCLHEDGLADTADGFGGGTSRERKLAIMRDSRIGTYGVCALALSILIRASALASVADPAPAAWALIAAHGAARAAMPLLMFLPPARADGLSFAAGTPSGAGIAVAALLGIIVLALGLGPLRAAEAVVAVIVAAALLGRLSLAQIGGQTGDVLGALEQVGEIVVLLVAAA